MDVACPRCGEVELLNEDIGCDRCGGPYPDAIADPDRSARELTHCSGCDRKIWPNPRPRGYRWQNHAYNCPRVGLGPDRAALDQEGATDA